MTIPISPNVEIKSSEVKGLVGLSNSSAYLTPTTSYQELVAAPASGVRRVSQIVLKNVDESVATVFYLKLVKSGTDYIVVQIELAPYEKLVLDFPWILDTNSSLQAKVAATCSGLIVASFVTWLGGQEVANFTGTSWADLLTVPGGSTYATLGLAVANTYTVTETVSIQVINDSSTQMFRDSKTLGPGTVWFLELNLLMGAGWKIQVKHGASSYTGSALVSWMEVP
ncbi:MAG: hypothetical protein GYA45_11630 [Pelolinea sp.]|nr:hypothetical protein [Pelolinea sp.]